MALPLIYLVGAGVALLLAKGKKTDDNHQQTLGEILTGGNGHAFIPFAGAAGEQQRKRFLGTPPAPGSVAQTPPISYSFKPQGFR